MKIVHQVNSLGIGGVETFVYRLCKFGEEETIVYSHEDGQVKKWLEDAGIKVYFKSDISMEKLIEKEQPDVIVMHTGSHYPDYAVPLSKKYGMRVKWISVMHTICIGEPWVDAIISISGAIGHVQIKAENSFTIYPGIERKSFVVGEVTRLAPYKYLEDLIKIAEGIVISYPNVGFLIIGHDAKDNPGYSEYLKLIVKEKNLQDHVIFLGWQEKIPYKDFDAFIHLVGNEAYPVTILEAINNNIPVITYDKIGTKEIYDQHPNYMNLVNNVNEAITTLTSIIEDKPKDIRATAQQFSEVYKKVMELE